MHLACDHSSVHITRFKLPICRPTYRPDMSAITKTSSDMRVGVNWTGPQKKRLQ